MLRAFVVNSSKQRIHQISAAFSQNHACSKLLTATVIQTIVRHHRLYSRATFDRLFLVFISFPRVLVQPLSSFAPVLRLPEIEEDPREREIDAFMLRCRFKLNRAIFGVVQSPI
jgi:hypothetical protein